MTNIDLKQFKLLIFDWDGTLANSIGIISSSLMDSFKELRLPELSYEKATSIIGLPLVRALEILTPGISDPDRKLLLETYKKYFLERSQTDELLFPGAHQTLVDIKNLGIKIAIATGKSRQGLERDMDITNVRHLLDITMTIDECKPKPDPDMLQTILRKLNLSTDEALMIGDTSFDLEMASNAGLPSIALTYGAHPVEQLLPHKPLVLFHEFSELSEFLLRGFAL